MIRTILKTITLCAALGTGPATAETTDIAPFVSAAMQSLALGFQPGDAESFAEFLAQAPQGVTGDTIGQLLYMRRHFDKAAWFFGHDALRDPDDPVSLNNFSAMLAGTYAGAPDSYPVEWLGIARLASQRAVALDPRNAAYQNNLGNAARHLGLIDEAIAAYRAAVDLDENEALFWANLARALEAAGDNAAAADALARTRALAPNGMAYAFARRDLPHSSPYNDRLARECNVNFRCQEICPKSIIGGLMSVTCEMENMSAQLACQEGRPYPTSYDCKEDFPQYGILIPGLNAGFSVAIPGFSAHVLVDGEGNVDVRVEFGVRAGPLEAHVGGDGHITSDGVSADNFKGGVRVVVLSDEASNLDISNVTKIPLVQVTVPGDGTAAHATSLAILNSGEIIN
jgi:hypothetical protein